MDVLLLENIVKEYPFFNSVQMLLAKKYQLSNHTDFDKQLKLAAIYSADRKILYNLITAKSEEEKIETNSQPISEEVFPEIKETVSGIVNEKTVEKLSEKKTYILVEEKTEEKKSEIKETDKHSFSEWMNLLQKKTNPISPQKIELATLANTTILTEQKTNSEKTETINVEELAMKSLKEDENLISATLAEIYANQGKHEKAIKLYEKLILQYPEKKDKFALKITELKSKL